MGKQHSTAELWGCLTWAGLVLLHIQNVDAQQWRFFTWDFQLKWGWIFMRACSCTWSLTCGFQRPVFWALCVPLLSHMAPIPHVYQSYVRLSAAGWRAPPKDRARERGQWILRKQHMPTRVRHFLKNMWGMLVQALITWCYSPVGLLQLLGHSVWLLGRFYVTRWLLGCC